MSSSANLGLPFIEPAQAQKHVTHNEALRSLDALVQLAVLDRNLATPPGSPAEGARYIVAATATGAWTGKENRIAAWQDGAWTFYVAQEGWLAWVADEDALIVWHGGAWEAVSAGGGGTITELQNLTRLGIGAVADATNPLTAKLNKVLWTAKTAAEGGNGDLRYTFNKETATDVLSLLFQSGFSARAEAGLIGDDDFIIKVSPDGSNFFEALRIDKDTGAVSFPNSSFGGGETDSSYDATLRSASKLTIKHVSAASIRVQADRLTLRDVSGAGRVFTAIDKTVNIGTAGANGLDAGSEASGAWYQVHVIAKADGTVAAILSLSLTAPTMPSGYVFRGWVGCVRNDASGNFLEFLQRGRTVSCGTPAATFRVLNGGQQTNFAAVSLAAVVPPEANVVYISAEPYTTSGSSFVNVRLAPAGSGATPLLAEVQVQASVSTAAFSVPAPPLALETAQTVYYRVAGTNAATGLVVTGHLL